MLLNKKVSIALPKPLYPGVLVRRYKRFLADVELPDGETVTAHCPNSGSMKTCSDPGSPVLLSKAKDPKRKTGWSWELLQAGKVWVGINTILPNRLVERAVRESALPEFDGWTFQRREAPYGPHSRIDLLLERMGRLCYIEVKNVTMVQQGIAEFPDAVTSRGTKHLEHLAEIVREGNEAWMVYIVQRGDGRVLRPADSIDPLYGETLRRVLQNGVRAVAYRTEVTPEAVSLEEAIPIEL